MAWCHNCCPWRLYVPSVKKNVHIYPPALLTSILSFISPAVVSPEIVDVEIPKDDGGVIRRGLMVIAKVIQNLANNIFFGKEAHMTVLNNFLHANVGRVTGYLNDVNVSSP